MWLTVLIVVLLADNLRLRGERRRRREEFNRLKAFAAGLQSSITTAQSREK